MAWDIRLGVCLTAEGNKLLVNQFLREMSLAGLSPEAVLGVPPGEHMVTTVVRITDDGVWQRCLYREPVEWKVL